MVYTCAKSFRLWLTLIASFGLMLVFGYAQTCTPELEPNNTPNEATPFSGITCLSGTQAGDQDIFVWTLTEQDLAGKAVAFDLESIPGQLTNMVLMRLELNDAGEYTSRQDLFTFGTQDGSKVSREFGRLEPGTYYLGIIASGGEGAYTLNIRLVEPTNVVAEATPLDDSLGAKGTFPESGKAIFSFATTEPQLFRVQTLGDGVTSLTYYTSSGNKGSETRGAAPLRLDNLALPAGTHYLQLTGQGNYVLKAIAQGPVPEGTALEGSSDSSTSSSPQAESTLAESQTTGSQTTEAGSNTSTNASCVSEVEPNNSAEVATALAKLGCFSGQLSSEDSSDYFKFTVDEALSQQRFDLEFSFSSDAFITITLQDDKGTTLQYRYFQNQGLLSDLVMKPGTYLLNLSGYGDAPLEYQVKVTPRGSPEAGFEQEPNDYPIAARPLGNDNSVKGRLVGSDEDVFRLEVKGEPQLWKLQATGQGLSRISYYDGAGQERVSRSNYGGDTQTISNLMLLPGANFIGVEGTDSDYTLRAIPLGPPDAADSSRPAGKTEREPNDDTTRAQLVRFDEPRVGLVAEADDWDVYRFTLYAMENIVVDAKPGEGGGLRVRLDNSTEEYGEVNQAVHIETTLLPGDHYLQVQANTPSDKYYQVSLLRAVPTTTADLAMTLTTDTPTLSAYWYQGQSVDATLTVENKSSSAKQLELAATTSHYAWSASLEKISLSLKPNETQKIPVKLSVLPDARDDQNVRVTVAAKDGSETPQAVLEFNAVCAAPPMNPSYLWPLPDSLLGGLDVAWSGLGGKLAQEVVRGEDTLFDGLVSPATGWVTQPGGSVTVELVAPTKLAGVLLNPQSVKEVQYQLKDFEVLVSNDGSSFTSALKGTLSAALTEQSFVFEKSVEAKFVQLKAINNQEESEYDIGLGEFKVVAVKQAGEAINIANPKVGGYLVSSNPLRSNAYNALSEDKEQDDWLYLEDNQTTMDWVIGFHNDRAAQITELQWEATDDGSTKMLDSVEVSISLESPIGPWQSLGTWQLSQAFKLTEPTWARFVKLSAKNLDPEVSYRVADTVRVLERPSDDEYQSIVGEWGQNKRAAIYEKLVPRSDSQALQESDNNDTKESAQVLSAGQTLSGQVTINEDVDWYKITVPASDNTLELILTGDPSVRATFELQDAQGKAVNFEQSGSASEIKLLATVTPGDYYLKLEEPPRSVVFSWDNSGSMGPYTDIIYQSVSNFVQDVEVGREVVQLLPFTEDSGGKFLLKDWSGDPYELMGALNNYDRMDSSSNGELNLLSATQALGKQPGTRAVMLMTDAESNGYATTPELWSALSEVQPRVFTFETSSAGSSYTQDLMQSWADVAGGYYDYARTTGDFDIGFARATCQLRRPAQYHLSVSTRNQAPPGPGTLTVTRSAETATLPAVEIILDASGSMDKKLGSTTRIAVAKNVLSELVTNVIPEGTPFALRVFGHKEPKSCRTDLDVPLGPLEPASVQSIIAEVEPKLLSGTPIAESLNQVASDLQSATGAKTVILLTDGEESCDGDVEAAIQNLQAQGIVFQLNVVSFADAEEAAKEQFRKWATLGGGVYLEGSNDEELRNGMTQTLSPSFEVIDANGSVVARGNVGGEAVSVPAGVYTVKVATGETFDNVRVPGEQSVELTLGAANP